MTNDEVPLSEDSQLEPDGTQNDPTYRTRARIDPNANRPETRGNKPLNDSMNFGFSFCTSNT